MNFSQEIAQQLSIREEQATATIELLDSGNTIPFIARYRKEATHGLDEEQLRLLGDFLAKIHITSARSAPDQTAVYAPAGLAGQPGNLEE